MTKAAVVFALITLAGCDVGVFGAIGDGGGGGGGGGSEGLTANCDQLVAAPPGATDHTANPGPGAKNTSNSGAACMGQAGCHGSSPGAGGAFEFAGTLWTDFNATTPLAGATITVVSGSMSYAVTTDTAGNFYHMSTQGTVALPATASTTTCPTTSQVPMTTMIGPAGTAAEAPPSPSTSTGGDCNGCHYTGGSTSPMYQTIP